jgi:4-hydroxybenzoate polyprenyltransferase
MNMASLKNKIKAYLRLIRAHTVIATALTPSLGAFATFSVLSGELISWDKIPILIPLFLVGIIVHVFGEILNDYMDYEIDKESNELSEKPLVSGEVSKRNAAIGLILCLVFLTMILIYFPFNLLSFLMLIIASSTGIIYQIISKKWLHSAILLGLYAFFIILFGGVYAGGYNNISSIPTLVYIIATLGFFQLWINTAILGHLKDIKNDAECGVETLPIRLGVKVEGKGKTPKLIIPMSFKSLVILIQIINLFIAYIPIIFYKRFYAGEINLFLLSFCLILLSIMIMVSQIRTLWNKLFERNKLMRMMAVREIGAYLLAIVLLSPFMGGIFVIIYIFLPLIWFIIVNLVYTGNPMQAAI